MIFCQVLNSHQSITKIIKSVNETETLLGKKSHIPSPGGIFLRWWFSQLPKCPSPIWMRPSEWETLRQPRSWRRSAWWIWVLVCQRALLASPTRRVYWTLWPWRQNQVRFSGRGEMAWLAETWRETLEIHRKVKVLLPSLWRYVSW